MSVYNNNNFNSVCLLGFSNAANANQNAPFLQLPSDIIGVVLNFIASGQDVGQAVKHIVSFGQVCILTHKATHQYAADLIWEAKIAMQASRTFKKLDGSDDLPKDKREGRLEEWNDTIFSTLFF